VYVALLASARALLPVFTTTKGLNFLVAMSNASRPMSVPATPI
jgi:hypothetical protein